MKMHYDLDAVRHVIERSEDQGFTEDGWARFSVHPADVTLSGSAHPDLIHEPGWPCRIEGRCCEHRQPSRSLPEGCG